MLLMQVVVFGTGRTKFVNSALLDGSSTIKINVSLSTIIVNNGITMEPVLLAMLAMFFKEVNALKEIHFVNQAIQMELVQVAIVAIFWITEVVCLSQSWLT